MQKSSLFFYDAAAPWINLASRLSEVDHIYLFFPLKKCIFQSLGSDVD